MNTKVVWSSLIRKVKIILFIVQLMTKSLNLVGKSRVH